MKTQIKKYGNTLVICIPEMFAEKVHAKQGTTVNVSLEDHKLVVLFSEDGQEAEELSLEQLLAGITDKNRHREIETGIPVGHEVW